MIQVHGIPLYWGIETEAVDKRFLVYSILHEAMPPFRHSTYGLRIRISPWHYLHVGKYRYDKNLRLYGLRIGVGEISTWGFKDEEKEAGPIAAAVEVRQPDAERPGELHRSGDRALCGTVPWPVTEDDRQRVGPAGDEGPPGVGCDGD